MSRLEHVVSILLDLEDPSRVIAMTDEPLLRPTKSERDGYVPNVVDSCGGILHGGTLWLPYGIGDDRVDVFSMRLNELLASMTWSKL